jgi:hypothetical protein
MADGTVHRTLPLLDSDARLPFGDTAESSSTIVFLRSDGLLASVDLAAKLAS